MIEMTFEEVFEQAQRLSPQERLRLVERLAAMLQAELKPKTDWHTFLRETYGILKDDPIQRYEQGEYEEREPLE
jgi:hypothetical protein